MSIRPGFPLVAASLALACASALAAAQSATAEASRTTLTASIADHSVAPDSTARQQPGESEIRIVRLSEVRGAVTMDRDTGNGLEPAFTNLPIVQGNRLETGIGVAEVEFEDNSSLRLTPNTVVEFPHLVLQASGRKISEIHVLKGTIYLSRAEQKDNEVAVVFGKSRVVLPPQSHIELSVSSPETRLRVLNGAVDVTGPAGTVNVGKKKMLAFDSADQTSPVVADNRDAGSYDKWDKQAADYHKSRATAALWSGGSSLYGTSDLAYYGSFVNLGGSCGSLWQPYFVGSGWDPYSNGTWAYYPSAGYSWVSPYPWGWTPFHYGSWENCGAAGWGWRPGGQWYGLRNSPAGIASGGKAPTTPGYAPGGATGTLRPKPPVPGAAHPSTVVVNARPLQVSSFSRGDGSFVFRQGSAGLGVPRQSFGKLNGICSDTAQHGTVARGAVSAPGDSLYSGAAASSHAAAAYGAVAGNPTGAHSTATNSAQGSFHSAGATASGTGASPSAGVASSARSH